MRILHVVGGLPNADKPFFQPFVKAQIDSLIDEGIDIEIYNIKGYESFFNYFKAVKKIKEFVEQKDIDIIHAHYSYCGLISYFAHTNKPIILSLMGSDVMGERNITGKISLRGKIDKLIAKFTIKKMDRIIVKSEKMKMQLKTKKPISVIPNGIDLELFKPANIQEARKKLGIKESDFVILFLGSKDNIVKNYKLAAESAAEFKNKMQAENIIFINPYGIGHQEVIDYMNASNVLLLTSFFEGSPNVIKEAMACNLPIISVDVGDVKEVIQDSFNCFVVNYSKEEISDKLKIIYENRKRSNGRERISHLNIKQIARRVNSIYSDLTNNIIYN